jgi:hypothetical protein
MDISNLTLGEIAKVEEVSGQALAQLSEDDAPKGRLLAALALVIKRRTNPKYSLEEAEALTMNDINALLSGDDEAKKE